MNYRIIFIPYVLLNDFNIPIAESPSKKNVLLKKGDVIYYIEDGTRTGIFAPSSKISDSNGIKSKITYVKLDINLNFIKLNNNIFKEI